MAPKAKAKGRAASGKAKDAEALDFPALRASHGLASAAGASDGQDAATAGPGSVWPATSAFALLNRVQEASFSGVIALAQKTASFIGRYKKASEATSAGAAAALVLDATEKTELMQIAEQYYELALHTALVGADARELHRVVREEILAPITTLPEASLPANAVSLIHTGLRGAGPAMVACGGASAKAPTPKAQAARWVQDLEALRASVASLLGSAASDESGTDSRNQSEILQLLRAGDKAGPLRSLDLCSVDGPDLCENVEESAAFALQLMDWQTGEEFSLTQFPLFDNVQARGSALGFEIRYFVVRLH